MKEETDAPGFPTSIPFNPVRQALYAPQELMAGFEPGDPATLADAYDYRTYRYWVVQGRFRPNYFDGMMQSLHDNAMSREVAAAVAGEKVVGIMGGHAMRRDDPRFADVALLARRLALAGFLVVSGGGPGVMEATHLGCFFAHEPEKAMDEAIARLARDKPAFPPNAGSLVTADGTVDTDILRELAAWVAPALELRDQVSRPGRSLGIPTWRYGHEPTSVFATQIAKYFDNSIREDGLMTIAEHGIVYAAGGAGTMQEVFQAAVFNVYVGADRGPSPMIFFGTEHWKRAAILTALRRLLKEAGNERLVMASDNLQAIFERIAAFDPKAATAKSGRRARRRTTPTKLRMSSLEPPGGSGWPV